MSKSYKWVLVETLSEVGEGEFCMALDKSPIDINSLKLCTVIEAIKSKDLLKMVECEWCENIPEHGVLCWVGDNSASHHYIALVKRRTTNDRYFRDDSGSVHIYAKPLTDDEIKQYLRGE